MHTPCLVCVRQWLPPTFLSLPSQLGSKLFPCIFLIGCADVPTGRKRPTLLLLLPPPSLYSACRCWEGTSVSILCTKLSVKAFLSILLKGELFLFPKGFISPSEVPFFYFLVIATWNDNTNEKKIVVLIDVWTHHHSPQFLFFFCIIPFETIQPPQKPLLFSCLFNTEEGQKKTHCLILVPLLFYLYHCLSPLFCVLFTRCGSKRSKRARKNLGAAAAHLQLFWGGPVGKCVIFGPFFRKMSLLALFDSVTNIRFASKFREQLN